MNIKSNSSTGYILEVDLEYPQELHDIHNDYPLAPEKINIPKEWLSDYCLKIANAHNITTGTVKKLVPNLMNKNNYVIHYRNLQQCLELGMKLKKIHRILKFKQKYWMKPSIDFNTQKRKEATNEADKNHFKRLNNAAYGKTMENMRKRIKIRIVKNCQGFITADILKNKTFRAIIKELFNRCRKLNISLVFITQSYFSVPKDVR